VVVTKTKEALAAENEAIKKAIVDLNELLAQVLKDRGALEKRLGEEERKSQLAMAAHESMLKSTQDVRDDELEKESKALNHLQDALALKKQISQLFAGLEERDLEVLRLKRDLELSQREQVEVTKKLISADKDSRENVFKEELADELNRAWNCNCSEVQVLSLRPGSVIATLVLRPHALPPGASRRESIDKLLAHSQDENSLLRCTQKHLQWQTLKKVQIKSVEGCEKEIERRIHELAAREKQFIDMQSALKNAKMARALDRWYAQFALLRKQRVALDRFVLRMKNVAIAGALDRWISNVKASKRQARVLERAVSRMTNSVVAGAFDRWQSEVVSFLMQKRTLERALLRMKNAKMAGALDSWQAQVVLFRQQRGTLDGAVLRTKNVAIAGALDRWMLNVKAAKRQARVP
jgi:hypothetical protein